MFLVNCHGDLLRKIALTAQRSGIARGEYSIIFFLSDPLSSFIGNYHWERGDHLDIVRANPSHAGHALLSSANSCEDPENVVRGGPTLTTFSLFYLFSLMRG